MDKPLELLVLGPAVLREIHFRLLVSPIGGMLRNLLSVDSHASRIAKAIAQIRRRFREPLSVADLARSAGMSGSSFMGTDMAAARARRHSQEREDLSPAGPSRPRDARHLRAIEMGEERAAPTPASRWCPAGRPRARRPWP